MLLKETYKQKDLCSSAFPIPLLHLQVWFEGRGEIMKYFELSFGFFMRIQIICEVLNQYNILIKKDHKNGPYAMQRQRKGY